MPIWNVPSVFDQRRKFGGMDVTDAKKLCELEAENAKLLATAGGRA